MVRRDLFHTDAAEAEQRSIQSVINKKSYERRSTKNLSVEEARNAEAVYKMKSTRDVTRVLFISYDESLLNPAQQSLDGYTNIADLFDEVHILILRTGIPTKTPVLRVADNVWLYTATHEYWWLTPLAGLRLAVDQLVFAEGFRPDLIVARDPFESAALALVLANKYNRSVQVHILENYLVPDFVKKPYGKWRRWLASFVLPRLKSVRTNTRATYDALLKVYKIQDLSLLPRFNNYEALMRQPATVNLKEKYKPFVFIMLYVGRLTPDAALPTLLKAARFGLLNPYVGLIVLGQGPGQKEFETRAEMLGVREQVVFEPKINDVVPYLKSANVLIVPDTNSESEEIVIKGAAAGIPLVLARTPAREDIFVDGESALLCDPNSSDDFSLKLNLLMNDVGLRGQMTEAAQAMVRARFHENQEDYERAYRESVEQVFFLDDTLQTETAMAEPKDKSSKT